MSALEAAEAEGGDWRGRGGAAIVVVPGAGECWERIVDLRVEEGADSLVELHRLLDRALGYREANRATADRARVAERRGLPASHARLLALEDAVDEGRLEDATLILDELESENPRWRDYIRALSKYPEMDAFARLLANRH
jgi:uncharacterized Ntn-hydrolase superfamily protein